MGDEQRGKVLMVALASGSLLIVVIGLAVALAGQWFGFLIAAFGVLDAATIPFVLRAVGSRRTRSGSASTEREGAGNTEAAAPDPTADPSYNPYARED